MCGGKRRTPVSLVVKHYFSQDYINVMFSSSGLRKKIPREVELKASEQKTTVCVVLLVNEVMIVYGFMLPLKPSQKVLTHTKKLLMYMRNAGAVQRQTPLLWTR